MRFVQRNVHRTGIIKKKHLHKNLHTKSEKAWMYNKNYSTLNVR